MYRRAWALGGGLLALVACSDPSAPAPNGTPRPLRQPGYFPVASFLEQQAARLNQQRPAVQKGVDIPDKFEMKEAMKTKEGEEEYAKHHSNWVMQGMKEDADKHKGS